MQCNTEVVNLIAKLQSNKFTQSLQNIPNYQHIEIEPIRYGYIFTEEKDFEILFMELGHLLNIDDVVELRELTEKEKNDYLSFIENVKNTSEICKGSKGKIYYFNKRIV